MATSYSYAEIEQDLPIVVKAELQRHDDAFRKVFAEEFGKKRRTKFHAYGHLLLVACSHRWYLGKPWMTVLQWLCILSFGIGFIWVFIDLFLLPGMIRERNSEIAKTILAEQKIISGVPVYGGMPAQSPAMNITVTNSQ